MIMNKRNKHKQEILQRLANTNDGMTLIKYLKEDYYDKSVYIKGDSDATLIKIAQEDIFKKAIKLIKDEDAFERVFTHKKNDK